MNICSVMRKFMKSGKEIGLNWCIYSINIVVKCEVYGNNQTKLSTKMI